MPVLLRERGYDVRVLLPGWECGHSGLLARKLQSEGIRYECLDFNSTERNTRWFLEQVRSDRPQAFIANHVLPALLLGGVLRRCGIPTVGVVRSDDPFYHALLEKFVAGRPQDRLSAVVCVSQYLSSTVSHVDNCQVATICSGTPLADTRTCWRSPLRIAYVGRFVQEQKRILDTTRTLVEVCRAVPGTTGVMIGDGPEFEAVQVMVRESGAAIDLPGALSPPQVLATLREAQVILLLSDYEGLPTAVVEAMSIGLVPVCRRMRSGIDELVIPHQTGFLVDEFPGEVVDAVQTLSRFAGVWETMSGNCQTLVREKFSITSSADQWAALLKSLVFNAADQCDIPVDAGDLCPFDPRWAAEDSRTGRVAPAGKPSILRCIRQRLAGLLQR
jgi:glycosyltransferase involved in cell wall biosynthesis